MKRGKDDEKVMGPMFPRLHVNDTEKGGPRAPPRNKMALYEQLSIPSQRPNHGVLPLNPINANNTGPPASSSQGAGPERNYVFPVHLPMQTPTYRAEKHISRQSDGANVNTSLAQLEQRKKVDEDDFRVPVYVHSRIGQSHDKTQKSFDGKKLAPVGSRNFGCTVEGDVQNDCNKDQKQTGSPHVSMRKDVRSENEGLPKVGPGKEQQVKSVRNLSNGENIDSLVSQSKATTDPDCPVANLSRLRQGDACLPQDPGVGSQSNDTGYGDGLVDSARDTNQGNVPLPRSCFHSTPNQSSPLETINGTAYHHASTGRSIHKGNFDKSDNVSKISMVDNTSNPKVSPDDVVEIIGQKHFWKARRAIINQQRVFAVQVFELHRLIKVQRLIAGSSDLLLEEAAFLGKSPLKGSSPKKLSLEYVVKSRQENLKRKNDSEKANHKMECSAENAIGKTSLSSVKNSNHISNYTPFSGNPQLGSVAADNRTGPWCFQQSPGHQWLIPVMSPSEGLVYKPYPGPEFAGTACGGCGPFGPAPMGGGGTFMNPAYGVPASHQGITPPGSYAYFPPYGMPVMNPAMSVSAVEQMNQFGRSDSNDQNGHLSCGGANFNPHNNQSSNNLPVQKNGALPQVMKFQASKERELQRSTASSPSELAEGISTGQTAEGRDALPLFPMAPVVPDGAPQSDETRQQTRVIKVVPHNPRSATESAARIFRSIQEERKQYD
ncbi:hypothetical protein L6164_024533 [Bauhinia variegata]|uniref:Uncharacterized protein n=1 Tax=Bauhinia variegata TaxID=167791 RepID=A0ACB9LYN7_BAUVA|nr:hypothetical protein L6164_024533 [Bauhinia variegata]